MTESVELTVEQALAQLREMFPGAEWLEARATTRWTSNNGGGCFAEIVVDYMPFRTATLTEAIHEARAWKEQQS